MKHACVLPALAAACFPVLGCGLSQRVAINTMVPIMDNSVVAAYRNQDLELVEAGLPGSVMLIEGLIETRPDDRRLLLLATHLYFSYAAGFIEPGNPERAEGLYHQALRYGFRAFPELEPSRTMGPEGEAGYRKALDDLDAEDVPELAWLVGSWASWIKLNLDRPSAMAQLPRLEALAERVVALDPAYLHGLPHLMLGTILALRPEPMGGNPERAQEEFQRGFAASDRKFLLMHLFYARYYCRQIFDEELFDSTIEELLSADPGALPDVVLFNRIAQRQGKQLLEMRDELF